jgi:hypothetical protein
MVCECGMGVWATSADLALTPRDDREQDRIGNGAPRPAPATRSARRCNKISSRKNTQLNAKNSGSQLCLPILGRRASIAAAWSGNCNKIRRAVQQDCPGCSACSRDNHGRRDRRVSGNATENRLGERLVMHRVESMCSRLAVEVFS